MKPSIRWMVLVGGGGCGRWQAGAIKALHDAGILNGLTGIVGTSVGGMNACAYASSLMQGRGADALMGVWDMIRKDSDVYSPSLPDSALSYLNPMVQASLVKAAGRFVWGPGAFDVGPLRSLVQTAVMDLTTDDVFIKLGLTVRARGYHYGSGVVKTLRGSLYHMALATSAIEGAFPAHLGFGDGGAGDNMPLSVALNSGANEVIIVYCGPEAKGPAEDDTELTDATKDEPRTGLQNVLDVVQHITACNEALVDLAAQRARAQGVQIIDCYPTDGDTGSALDFTERGLYERGLMGGMQAVVVAQSLGWKTLQ